MGIYLRQVCLVAETLAPVVADLKHVLSLNTAYVDEEVAHFGLENTLLTIGTNFIEVVAPIRSGTAARRYLERRGGNGGYMIIGQVLSEAEQAACRARAAENHVRVAWEAERPGWKIMQLHPADMRAAFFEVDWEAASNPEGHWSPAGGNGWQGTVSRGAVSAINGVELQGPDPDTLADLWAEVAGRPAVQRDGEPAVLLENAALRFVREADGRGAGLSGIDLDVVDRASILRRAEARGLTNSADSVEIGGVRFRLRD